MPEWFYGQDAYDLIDRTFTGDRPDAAHWRDQLRAALDDKRQVVIRLSNGHVLVSPTRCTRPNILILDGKLLPTLED